MPHSHHSHSGQFCRHAKDSLEDVVKEAISQGFELFGLSEHAPRYRLEDLFPEEADLTPSDLSTAYTSFLSSALALRETYRSSISLLIGVETDYITSLDSSGLSSLLLAHPEIDYVVGSVHHVNGVSIDFDRPTWLRAVQLARQGREGTTMRAHPPPPHLVQGDPHDPELLPNYEPGVEELIPFFEKYLDAQFELLRTHRPEVVGHFDLCLLWTPEISLKSLPSVWRKVERNVREVVQYGGLFEANAAAIRKGWGTSYPNPEVLQLILSLGGRICFSDDSHGTSYVGLNYVKMRDYLVREKVEEIWYLVPSSRRQEGDADIGGGGSGETARGRVVARRMTRWADHPFWVRLEAAQAIS